MKALDSQRTSDAAPSSAAPPAPAKRVATEEGPRHRPVAGGLAFGHEAPPANDTGLPDQLKAGVEQLSGISLDGVKVHYRSGLPAQVGAHAYTRGQDIHVAPGQERHLPHEAWHVVQQAQGRVRPTLQLKGIRPVNDDHGLEREADVMGARALRWRPSGGAISREQLAALPGARGGAPIQMVKIVATAGDGGAVTLASKPDAYVLAPGETAATDEQIAAYKGDDADILAEKSPARKRRRDARRVVAHKRLPKPRGKFKKVEFPVVVQGSGGPASLVYRGMSVNNINNMQKVKGAIFTAQNPTGTASAVKHIVHDSQESPYLSFEAKSLAISAGKYAHKPVDADNKPLHVEKKEGGFLKQAKSYTQAAMRSHGGKRLGYVGGIPKSPTHLDVSTKPKAEREFAATKVAPDDVADAPKAAKLAKADAEILVRPGEEGIGAEGVPFVAKVKTVSLDYFKKNMIHQTDKIALGFFKPSQGDPVYTKIQVLKGDYKFRVRPEYQRNDEDSESEMSDVEEMNMGDYE